MDANSHMYGNLFYAARVGTSGDKMSAAKSSLSSQEGGSR